MKKRYSACIMAFFLTVCLLSLGTTVQAKEFSNAQMKKMSVFLSNFTELYFYNFSAKEILNEKNPADMIRFGIWHNYINNYKSRIKPAGNKLSIDGKFVKESVKKYFNYNIKNLKSVGRFTYDGKKYTFDGADGEAIYYAKVTSAKTIADGVIEMKGYLYNADDESDRNGTFTALAKPYTYGGKNTWSIISMKHVN